MNLYELTKKLISIPSVTGSEQEVISFVSDFLGSAGLKVVLQPVSDQRANIFAFAQEPSIVFTTHLDTVPGYVEIKETDFHIYGRGSCDAKGIAAAQIIAALDLIQSGFQSVGLLFVCGEERGSDGAMKANTLPNNSRYIINGEPTENRLASGTKGVFRIKLVCRGKAAHSAYPERGESAVSKLLAVLDGIRNEPLPSDLALGQTTLNIGTIHGGVTGNVIPEYAEAELMFRTTVSVETISDFVKKHVKKFASMEILFACEPLILQSVEGFEAEFVSFATDLSLLTCWGERLLTGPGSILDAHTDQEKIEKIQLENAVKYYKKLAVLLSQRIK